MINKKTMQGLLTATTLLLLPSVSSAAINTFAFNNLNGLQKINGVGNPFKAGVSSKTNIIPGNVFVGGGLLRINAKKVNANTNEGGRVRSNNQYTNGTVKANVKLSGADAKNTWGAFWMYNDIFGANTWEIDMMETTPQGNQNNFYTSGNQAAKGAKFANPKSLGWRDNFRVYQANFNRDRNSVNFNNGGATHTSVQAKRSGKTVKINFSNRPFAFSVKGGAGGKDGKAFAQLQSTEASISF